MWKAKNVQICSQEAYLPWSTVHKNAEQHIGIRKKSCIGSDIGSNAALVCFWILHPISAAGTTYWQKQILNAFPKRFRILSKIQINLLGIVYKNSLKSQLSFRINVRKANSNNIYIFICLSHFLAELFSTPLRQRYCCNIAGHHNLPGEKFTQNTKNINKKEIKRNWLQNVGQIFQKHVKTFNMYSIFIYAALLMARGTTYPKVSNIESFWLLAFLASSSDHWGRSFYSNN